MSDRDAFERILASLYDAMLDETHWPATSALIDEACGLTGNGLLVGEGPKDDIRVQFIGLYARGQRRPDLEREYLEVYHPLDERVPRFRQLPESRLVPVKALYTAEELKTSPAYNEAFLKSHYQEGLNVRLKGLEGSHLCWALGDPVGSEGWGTSQIAHGQAAPAPHPAICARPAGAGARPSAGHDRGRPAGDPSDRRRAPGSAGADPGRQ